jgi:MurNAc alpha-1-phosphate uridylyltransferase
MQLNSPVHDPAPYAKASAMILAAGRGERMRPLTDHTPKPLLAVRGKPLMQWPMEGLVRAGFERILINTAWLGECIHAHYGSTAPLSGAGMARLSYSNEEQDFGYALETAGGISRALPHLAEVFWVVAGDVFVPEFSFDLQAVEQFTASDKLAHIWLVPNPPHNPLGDFGLSGQGLALNVPNVQAGSQSAQPRYTFSTIALYRRALFDMPHCDIVPGNPQGTAAPLAPLLRAAMDQGLVSATLYTGPWTDVGTPERLAQLNAA